MAHAAGDATDIPIYGAHYCVTFPLLDADGDPVTGAASLDSEVSIDLGTFADCTNEATEIATNSGVYYLYLTGAEMTGKIITVQVKTSSAKTTVLSIYPVRMAVIATGTAQAGAAGTITLAASTSKQDNDLAGYYVRLSNNSPSGVQYATRRIVSNVASTQVATVESNWGTNPSSATTYDLLAPSSVNVTSFGGTMPTSIATAGIQDVNVKNINNAAAATPGASGGLLISGSNSGTTTFGALTCTGTWTVSGGITVTNSNSNQPAVSLTGNGSGAGLFTTSAGTGPGTYFLGVGNNYGLRLVGAGSGAAFRLEAGATGTGMMILGGGTSGNGITITTTSGHGISSTATGASKHGAVFTGGNSGVCDGVLFVAGTGGVGWRSDSVTVTGVTTHTGATTFTGTITATDASNNIVGIDVAKISGDSTAADNLELFFDGTGYNAANSTIGTVTTYTGNTPQTGDSYAIVNSGTHGNAAIKGYVDDIGVAGAGLTAIPWNATWDAEVQSEVEDALIVHRLDELLNADSDIDGAAPPTVGSVFHELMTKTAGSFTYDQTTDSLEAIRDRGDAAWITATGFSTHTAADVWAVGTRTLTAGTNIQLPSNGLANVTAWTVDITGSLSGSVGSIGTGGITSASFASAAIDASAIATDAFGALEISAGAASEIATAVLTTQMTEAYAADGTAPTLAQATFRIMQNICDFSISGTTITTKKLDKSTAAETYTLNDASTPTSRTRAT